MIFHGLFGMRFLANGIFFHPARPYPETFLDTQKIVSLLNVSYRKARLDIHVDGYGNRVSSFKINGIEEPSRMLKASSKGKYVIEITMTSS
jgi:hypothetical protein